MQTTRRLIYSVVVLYFSWLGMMLVHECGHMLHAWLSGGHIVSVSIPLIGFSQTIVSPDPKELFVVWGGPIWGVVIPLLACGIVRLIRRRIPQAFKFFAGFCLIANGLYIGMGPVLRAGDSRDMLRLDTPPWLMVGFGTLCLFGGLSFWHRVRFSLH